MPHDDMFSMDFGRPTSVVAQISHQTEERVHATLAFRRSLYVAQGRSRGLACIRGSHGAAARFDRLFCYVVSKHSPAGMHGAGLKR